MNIPSINQRDYGNAFCLASCYLAIAQYFGNNVTMQDLIDKGAVEENGDVNNTGGYFTRSALKTYNATNIKNEIDNGNPVIIKGTSSWGTHFVVAYDYSGSTIKVMDPWGGVKGNLGSTVLTSWSGYYVCS